MPKSKVTSKAARGVPQSGVHKPLTVIVGWDGRLGEIVSILEKPDSRTGRKPRPIRKQIDRALAASPELARALANDQAAVARGIAQRVVRKVLGPGIKPVNRPSTAARKGGDNRATRNVRGRDAIYRLFKVLVRQIKSGRFA